MRTGQANARSLALGLTALAAATAACLPRGDPPSGRQVIAGRESQLAAIAPPNGDGVLRILVLRPGAEADTRDLYVVSVDSADGPPSERLLLTGLDPTTDLGCIHRLAPCSIDPDGWTFLYSNLGNTRLNTITGERMDMGRSFGVPFQSESGQRSFMLDAANGGPGTAPGTLTEPDGSTMTFDVVPYANSGQTYAFVGEDFYYLTPQGDLMHVPPAGGPERLATGVDGFRALSTPDGLVLLLNRPTSDPDVQQTSVRDSVTGEETVLPFNAVPTLGNGRDGNLSLSSDGRWMLHVDSAAGVFDFYDYRAGRLAAVPAPASLELASAIWRPGTPQVWAQLGTRDAPTIWILTPDAPPVLVGNVRFWFVYTPGSIGSSFTPDGAYWFSTASDPSVSSPVIQVGLADDPTGPLHDLAPPGVNVDRYWPVADGRLLTTVYTKDIDRADLMAFDPRTGDDRLLGEKGRVAAVGETRALGLLHFEGGAADLTAIEIASGRQTILAPEFAVTAFAEPQGADPVAPGTRVVYEFEARSPSPYDGVWVVNVP
jgi:hypothetical protein